MKMKMQNRSHRYDIEIDRNIVIIKCLVSQCDDSYIY